MSGFVGCADVFGSFMGASLGTIAATLATEMQVVFFTYFRLDGTTLIALVLGGISLFIFVALLASRQTRAARTPNSRSLGGQDDVRPSTPVYDFLRFVDRMVVALFYGAWGVCTMALLLAFHFR